VTTHIWSVASAFDRSVVMVPAEGTDMKRMSFFLVRTTDVEVEPDTDSLAVRETNELPFGGSHKEGALTPARLHGLAGSGTMVPVHQQNNGVLWAAMVGMYCSILSIAPAQLADVQATSKAKGWPSRPTRAIPRLKGARTTSCVWGIPLPFIRGGR
jgi:hypothetical protein